MWSKINQIDCFEIEFLKTKQIVCQIFESMLVTVGKQPFNSNFSYFSTSSHCKCVLLSHRHKWPVLPVLWILLQWLQVLRGAIFTAHLFRSLPCTEILLLQYLVEPRHLTTRPQAWDHSNSRQQQLPLLPPHLLLRQCHLDHSRKLCTPLKGRLQRLRRHSCLHKSSLQFQLLPLQSNSSNPCHSRAQLHLFPHQLHRCSLSTPQHL